MIPFNFAGPWVKASAFAGLTGLSMSDVIVTRHGPPSAPAVVPPRIEKPFVYDATEDLANWGAQYRRDLTEAEHLEIHASLAQFVKVLIEQVAVMESDPELKPLLHDFIARAGGI
ncbi:MAG: hypothetical protein AAB036_00380 [Elusimicrobiota bacterium]